MAKTRNSTNQANFIYYKYIFKLALKIELWKKVRNGYGKGLFFLEKKLFRIFFYASTFVLTETYSGRILVRLLDSKLLFLNGSAENKSIIV